MGGLAVICLCIKGVVRVVRPRCDVRVASSPLTCVTHYGIEKEACMPPTDLTLV